MDTVQMSLQASLAQICKYFAG